MLFFKPFRFVVNFPLNASKALPELAVVVYDLFEGLARREEEVEL